MTNYYSAEAGAYVFDYYLGEPNPIDPGNPDMTRQLLHQLIFTRNTVFVHRTSGYLVRQLSWDRTLLSVLIMN